jgi:hypothetical protein
MEGKGGKTWINMQKRGENRGIKREKEGKRGKKRKKRGKKWGKGGK